MPTFHEILDTALPYSISDLHLSAGIPPVCRSEGRLISLTQLPVLTPGDTEDYARELLSAYDYDILRKTGEVDVSYASEERNLRMRVNIYRERGKYCLALRVLRQDIPSFEDLHLPVETMESLCKLNQGLVLITGQTGMGKTTTISSMINWINNHYAKHIITIEDPIEYFHSHKKSIIHQRETGEDTQSFGTALRAALRQDPDIIFIGEMRDLESISIALTAAETGHLVFSTLHTNGAAKTIDRIIDSFQNHQQPQIRAQLSLVLRAVLSQQLIPSEKGGGREIAYEILLSTPAVRNLIRENHIPQIQNSILTGSLQGMISMEASLVSLALENRISDEDAFNSAPNQELYKQLLERRKGGFRIE